MIKLWSAYLNTAKWFWRGWYPRQTAIAWLFIAAGFLSFSLIHWQNRLTAWQLDQAISQAPQSLQFRYVNQQPANIKIGDLIDVSVGLGHYHDGSWTNNLNQAVYWTGSALPGQGGNIIIYGHNLDKIFGRLPRVTKDQIITLTLANGQQRQYQIQSTQHINHKNTKILDSRIDETLVLYTCSGIFDTQRFVIIAQPVTTDQFCFTSQL